MSAQAIEYGELLRESKPEVIHSERENEHYIEALEGLVGKGDALTPAERKLAELLTVLVKEFESRHYELESVAGPLDVIRHLIEANGLRQKDLVDVFGTESIVSDVLNGKRELTKDHIARLSVRFGISPATFF